MRGGSVAIVGGSIGGCAAAMAAVRAGAERVEVFERSGNRLEEWGMGLAVNQGRYEELAAADYLDDDIPFVRFHRRRWIVRDGDAPAGRELGVQGFDFRGYTWSVLWRELRRRVSGAAVYHPGTAVRAVASRDDAAEVTFQDGSSRSFDLVVGGDGYRSTVRDAVFPDSRPTYARYVAWRGTLPASELPDGLDWDPSDAITVLFPQGHAVLYRIPSADGGTTANWLVYGAPPAETEITPDAPTSLPPGRTTDRLIDYLGDLVERHLPPLWAEIVRRSRDRVYVQPIYDFVSPRYVSGRLALLGDAATVARPHTGAGAVKALQDASALEAALRETATWDEALHRYDRERRDVGLAMVDLGRRLGLAQVEQVPDWSDMDDRALRVWWAELVEKSGGFGGFSLNSQPVAAGSDRG
ncbi:FAD-dependent monooxygenase [Yinghuangia sp. ASG 101]|uniref:FAD-dependent monooxygenase n=1 Tax=Yinghuangia sp. ASG 101 TaxID=2896848 RepID=UPI001E60ED28|nr:FAD-dependent monooxygenase [Yinghuangia sp. ASG 101]UGQ12792.1 FAD-dependent monooxygenase [Yinghuangia sp. ASG 101]